MAAKPDSLAPVVPSDFIRDIIAGHAPLMNRPPWIFAARVCGGLLFAGALNTSAQEAAEPPVKLPDMVITKQVTKSFEEDWRYARVGRFEVLSGVADRRARVVLRELDKFSLILPLVWVAAADPSAEPPTSIILCGPSNHLFAFLPADGSMREENSVVWHTSDRATLVLNMDAILPDQLAGGSDDEFVMPDDFERQAAQLYLRLLLAGRKAELPRWLEAGLLQTLADIEIWGSWLTYGKVETEQNMPSGEQPLLRFSGDPCAPSGNANLSFKQVFAHRDFLPFSDFFDARQENGQEPSFDSLWAKQAYTFVHYCLFGGKLRQREALGHFVNRLSREPLSEALFKECFGAGYRGMEKQLRAYLGQTRHQYQRYPVPAGLIETRPRIEFTDATQAQIGRIKGDASALAGRFDFALRTFARAYDRGVREPDLLASFGLALLMAKDRQQAQAFLNRAIAADVDRPAAYIAQARLRLADFRADPGPDGRLTQQQVAAVLTPLFHVRKVPPPGPDLYIAIAEAWSMSSVAPKPAHLAVLDEGVRRFPRNSALLYNAAQLYRQVGAAPTAASIAKLGLRFSSDPAAKTRFEELLASLPATPAK